MYIEYRVYICVCVYNLYRQQDLMCIRVNA